MSLPTLKGKPTTREVRSQQSQQKSHAHGSEKGVKWPMAVKDGSRDDSGSVKDTGVRGTNIDPGLFEIQRNLDSDKYLSAYGLKASFSNNVLQVTGIVDTLADKDALKKLLSRHGISKFADAVSISTDGQVIDSHVVVEVQEELKAAPYLKDLDIGVHCVSGTVFLVGDVEEPEQEELAVTAARKARGVTEVISQLKHQGSGAESLFDPQDLESPSPWSK